MNMLQAIEADQEQRKREDVQRNELTECLRIAMLEWRGWHDEARGDTPDNRDWRRCLAAIGGSL